uniref:Secreted protein n=1 Tax=Ixodes ricinus TaxID=34613 RepID=A0A6B0U2L9_IXORI
MLVLWALSRLMFSCSLCFCDSSSCIRCFSHSSWRWRSISRRAASLCSSAFLLCSSFSCSSSRCRASCFSSSS